MVYFEDDEDANGGRQYRRIPVEHVMIEDDGDHTNRHGYAAGAGVGGRSNGSSTGRSERVRCFNATIFLWLRVAFLVSSHWQTCGDNMVIRRRNEMRRLPPEFSSKWYA